MSFFEGFDIEKLGELLPSATSLMEGLNRWLALFVLVGPLLMLGFGVYYLFFAPKEANHSMGFRFGYAMSCVEVWQFTQRLAGIAYAGLGLLLTVIIGLISLSFKKQTPPDMVWLAGKCLLWEVVLAIIITLLVDIVIVVLFDIKGNPRSAKTKALTKAGKFSRSAPRKSAGRSASGTKRTGTNAPRRASTPAGKSESSTPRKASTTAQKSNSTTPRKASTTAQKSNSSTPKKTSTSGGTKTAPKNSTQKRSTSTGSGKAAPKKKK